ncbi:MAG: S1 family peptidase [Hamadaea sp.]|nr:S1 family peptidase [Hamadaea sp.]
MLAAVQRDLHLSADAARARLDREAAATHDNLALRKTLGDRYGGAWLAPDASLTVAVTTAADLSRVREHGVTGKLVARSERQLDAAKARLDAKAGTAPSSVPGWFVDPRENAVVVLARDLTAARDFVRRSGVDSATVRIVASAEQPRTYIDVIGGNAYYIGSGTRCSVGFSVNGGFVTAGHCGTTGSTTTQPSGTFAGSSFPGNDYAWVRVATGNTPRGLVNNYAGGTVTVNGSTEAAVGATVCRSGSTTGWHCGTIQARNSSVTYPEGTVSGLIRTTVCAEPGDSGGSLLAGNQAQGVTSGGSGNCSSGGTTYFQPVNEILGAYGLTLVTGGGGPGPTSSPTTPPTGCSGYQNTRTNSLASGGARYEPDGSYYYSSGSGTHSACLAGPSGTDFDLYFQKWNGSSWVTVASGTTPANSETTTYSGTAGYYRYQVHAYSGSGTYTLGYNRPA